MKSKLTLQLVVEEGFDLWKFHGRMKNVFIAEQKRGKSPSGLSMGLNTKGCGDKPVFEISCPLEKGAVIREAIGIILENFPELIPDFKAVVGSAKTASAQTTDETGTRFVRLGDTDWATENLEVGEKKYFSFDEANEAAREAGLRLPTVNELNLLRSLPHVRDSKRGGFWFAETAAYLGNPDESVFLPASGFRTSDGHSLSSVGSCAYCWGCASDDNSYAILCFSDIPPIGTVSASDDLGFPVRCVKQEEGQQIMNPQKQ
jgi:hypothetical protein